VTLTWNVMAFGYDFGFLGTTSAIKASWTRSALSASSGDIKPRPGQRPPAKGREADPRSTRKAHRASNLLAAFQHEIDAQRQRSRIARPPS
jgi:hypothetical protein